MTTGKKISLIVTQASLNQTAMDFPRNMANIYAAIREAVVQKADILALEELAVTGYEANDEFEKTDNKLIQQLLQDVADYAAALDPNLIISVGHPWRLAIRDVKAKPGLEAEREKNVLFNRIDRPFNAQSFIAGGQIQSMTAKMYLFNDERGYENRYFQEWSMAAADEAGGSFGTIPLPLDGRNIPFGRPIVHIKSAGGDDLQINLSHVICEERWVGTKFGGAPYSDAYYDQDGVAPSIMRRMGRDGLVLVMPNASPPASLKIDKHTHLVKMASQYADAVIDTDGLGSSGSTFSQFGHRLVAQDGKIVSFGTRNNFARVATTTSTIAVTSAPALSAWKTHLTLTHEFRNAAAAPQAEIAYEAANGLSAWDDPANPDRFAEETIRMAALWLFDYIRKNKFQGVAEALSGGKDSAFNSLMVKVMVELAVKELGVEGFLKEMKFLKYADKIREAARTGGTDAAIRVCMDNMLTTVYMGTNNSSQETEDAAAFLIEGADGIGGTFESRNVQGLLNENAFVKAVPHSKDIPLERRTEMLAAISGYLNQSKGKVLARAGVDPETLSNDDKEKIIRKELDRQGAELRVKYPEITGDLITAADTRTAIGYENIQARAREVQIWADANAQNKLAIANPNLDEARNAYATFGGDLHSGSVNLNAFLPKKFQVQLMEHLYRSGLQGVMKPVKALEKVLGNPASAELAPKDEKGKVEQNDEDALQRSFGQMDRIARLIINEKVMVDGGLRLRNASEVFEECQKDSLFQGVDENRLYNMVKISYARWWLSQHKIHAAPIAPTFGLNVDHQTSKRTPNTSGQSKNELAHLGASLMLKWAARDGITLPADPALELKRAHQDEAFIEDFDNGIWNRTKGRGDANMDYNLAALYDRVKTGGWGSVFRPLSPNHPLIIIRQYRAAKP